MPDSISPQKFVAKWRLNTLKEKSAYQSHFNDVCALVGHATPTDIDPNGDFFAFEAGATKDTGGQGFADVWYKGRFAWEYKGPHANLDKAYDQLKQYRESLQNPPLLIVSDLQLIRIHTNFTNAVKKEYTLSLDDLLIPEKLAILHSAFYNPEALKVAETAEQVTQQAAAHFSRLAQILRGYGEDPQKVAHFLIQMLFCLFAEDVGLLPNNVFTQLVKNSHLNSSAFVAQLRQLFAAMSTGGWFGPVAVPHFDGRLFEGDAVLELDSDGIAVVDKVASLDWSSIEPSVFGVLFERSLDPSKRSQLGAHYTSKDDILLIVEPVLMSPLRREWEQIKAQARDLAARREQAKAGRRAKANAEITALLTAFTGKIAGVQVLDPACGSGNFLYVALRLLLDLWKEVSSLSAELGLTQFLPLIVPTPAPEQLHGIEINEYAHQLAQATIWIGYLQWMRENGYGFREPILRPLDNMLKMDAILAFDEQGRAVEPEWPRADVIIGNPPFLGDKKMRSEMGFRYVETLRSLYENRIPGQSDLVCYWFERARSAIEQRTAKRIGLLATNSIRGGANRVVLERIKQTGDIFWAISDRDWILDGAAVNVSMIGFDDGNEKVRCLDGNSVFKINADLTSFSDLTSAKQLKENLDLAFIGTQKGGKFDIPYSLASEFFNDKGNPNNRPNSEVIFPWINGLDITSRPRNMWIIDFGTDTPEEEAALYEKPFEYIRRYVKQTREEVNSENRTAAIWWLFQRPRPEMRKALIGLHRYIASARVAKHRLFIWVNPEVIPDSQVVVIARSDDFFFGVLHAKPHELWALRLGTALEDRPRYTPTTTFETYPFPWPPGKEPQDDPRVQAVAQAARELVQYRDNWLNPPGLAQAELKKRTLTNLYNQRPTWLQIAHRKLDQAVFAAYGWPDDLSDEQILERLLALNLSRAGVRP